MAPVAEAERPHPLRRGRASSCSTATAPSRPSSATRPREFFTGGYIDAPAAAGQARRRVLLVHGAVGAPVRDAQLHLAPARRADDGPRARPRRARGAGAPAGDLPVHDPADAWPRPPRSSARRSCSSGCSSARPTPPSGSSLLGRRRSTARWRAVFRQVAMNRFEDAIHTERRERGELSVDALRRAVARHAGRPARRRGRARRRLRLVVVVHPALRRHARLRLRLRVRPPARAVGLPAATRRRARASSTSYLDLLRAGGSRPPEELGEIVGRRPHRPGLLELRARPDRAPARRRRGAPPARRGACDRVIAERIALPGGEVELMRPPRRRGADLGGGVRARGVPALLGGAVVERGGAGARRVAPLAARGADARARLRARPAEHRGGAARAGACSPPTGRRTR